MFLTRSDYIDREPLNSRRVIETLIHLLLGHSETHYLKEGDDDLCKLLSRS